MYTNLIYFNNTFYHKCKAYTQGQGQAQLLIWKAFNLLSGSRSDTETGPASVFAVILLHPVLLLLLVVMFADNYDIIQTCN